MSNLLLLGYLLILILIISRSRFFYCHKFSKFLPIILFLLKFVGGIAVYLVYAKYYNARMSSDMFKYFDDGNIIHSAIYQNPIDYLRIVSGIGSNAAHLEKYYLTCNFWTKPFNYGLFNDNTTVIRLNALIRLISMENIHIHTLFMSFLSFLGLWGIFKVFIEHFEKQKWLLVLTIFFFPSVCFWTSGILKESILMFAFGILIYNFNKLIKKNYNFSTVLAIIFAVFMLCISKFYILVAAVPGLFLLFLTRRINQNLILKIIIAHLLFLGLSFFTKPIIGISFTDVLANKQHDFINMTNEMQVGSKIDIPVIEATPTSIIKAIPSALLNSFFRPTVFEIKNIMMLLAALENLIIVLGIVMAMIFFSTKKLLDPKLWFCLSFVFILFTLIGLTTPILGALVRYKAPALPFLGIALLYIIDFEKINRFRERIFSH